MSGWIKLHRQFKANGHFHMPDRALKVWLYILMTVSHRDQPQWGLKAGEGWISYDMIAEDCADHRAGRVRREAVANALKYLEEHGYIEREIEPGKGQKIRVVNWHKYQGQDDDTSSATSSATSSETEPPEMPLQSLFGDCSSETEPDQFRNGTTTGTTPSSETEPVAELIQECKELSNKKTYTPPNPPYGEIVAYLNERAGTSFRPTTKETQRHINARWKDGFRVDDFKAVIDVKVAEWMGTDREQYLRPQTLFGTKFESYLQQAKRAKTGRPGFPVQARAPTDLSYLDQADALARKAEEYARQQRQRQAAIGAARGPGQRVPSAGHLPGQARVGP